MKVLIPNLHFYHFRNIAACLQTVGPKVNVKTFLWNVEVKPIIDAFDEVSPDLVFLHEGQLDSAFNMLCDEFDFDYVLVASKEPVDVNKKPVAIITSTKFESMFKNHSNVMSLLPAAKVTEIHAANQIEMLESEVLVITGVVPHTEAVVNSMRALAQSYRTKIIGEAPVSLPNYLGNVTMFERADFIKSAKILVDFGAYDYLDAAYLNTMPLFGQPPPAGLEKVKTFSNIPTLLSGIDSLLSKDGNSDEYSQDIHNDTIENHTYYHRCAKVFDSIGMTETSEALLDFLKELLK